MKYLYNEKTIKGQVERELHLFIKEMNYKSDGDVLFSLSGVGNNIRSKLIK